MEQNTEKNEIITIRKLLLYVVFFFIRFQFQLGKSS